MSIKNNTTSLQEVLEILNTKVAGGEQAIPEISVSSNGLITATAGIKSSTYQLAFQPAKTITPSTTSQVIVSAGYYTGGDITVVGDSNLVAGNIKSGVSIFGVNGTLEEGSMEGVKVEYSENEDAIVDGTIRVTYINDRTTMIRNHAFRDCHSLATVSFPVCTSIGSYAFCDCSRLTDISFPVCTSIGSYAFAHCKNLTTVNFPICTSIGSDAFRNCQDLTAISFPVCTSIGSFAFYSCRSLATVNFPVCTSIGSGTFRDCASLTTANFPACTNINQAAFQFCESLTTINFPVCTSIGTSAFFACYSLTAVNFPACTSIGSSAFHTCLSLVTASFPACEIIDKGAFSACQRLSNIYLGVSSVCTLMNSNAFLLTPFAGYSSYFSGTPHIYVPSSLITAYQSATNWTYFSSYFSAIESLEA